MKRRLRKKKYLGEFREDCFEIEFSIVPPHTSDEDDAFWDAFIVGLIEGRGLQFGGGGGRDSWRGVVEVGRHGESGAAHRQAVIDWLTQHPGITDVKAGPLRDANYGWD